MRKTKPPNVSVPESLYCSPFCLQVFSDRVSVLCLLLDVQKPWQIADSSLQGIDWGVLWQSGAFAILFFRSCPRNRASHLQKFRVSLWQDTGEKVPTERDPFFINQVSILVCYGVTDGRAFEFFSLVAFAFRTFRGFFLSRNRCKFDPAFSAYVFFFFHWCPPFLYTLFSKTSSDPVNCSILKTSRGSSAWFL